MVYLGISQADERGAGDFLCTAQSFRVKVFGKEIHLRFACCQNVFQAMLDVCLSASVGHVLGFVFQAMLDVCL